VRSEEEGRHGIKWIFRVKLLFDYLYSILAPQGPHAFRQLTHDRLFIFGHLGYPWDNRVLTDVQDAPRCCLVDR
jgi:hypothetical protein